MSCFSEMTYSLYLDGELSQEERLKVEAHLGECAPCRAVVAAMDTENQLLRETFQLAGEDQAASRARVGRSLLWTGASALAAAMILNRVMLGLERLVPSMASWVNPFSLAWLQTFVFAEALELVKEGPAMLNTLVSVLGFLVLGAMAAGLLRYLLRRHPMSAALVAMMLLALGLPPPASAIERRHAHTVRVQANETVDQSLAASGETVDVAGTVNGNLFVAGARLELSGDIKGDVYFAGQIVEITGTVEGNLYAGCNSVTVSGRVAHNVYVGAQTFYLDPAGHVDGDVWAGAGDVRLRGGVGRDVTVGGNTVEASGAIGRDLVAYSELVTVASSARIGRNLQAHVRERDHVEIDPGATVAGKTEITLIKKEPSRYTQAHFYYWQAIAFAGAFIIGLLLYWLFPVLFSARLESGGTLGRTAGIGFLILLVAPIAAVIACITLVGLPVGIIGLLVWLVGLYLAKVFVGALVGKGLLERRTAGASQPFALLLLIGLLLIFVAIDLPYVGVLISFIVILVGLGLAFRGVREGRRGTVGI